MTNGQKRLMSTQELPEDFYFNHSKQPLIAEQG